jgi:hypothetical protein
MPHPKSGSCSLPNAGRYVAAPFPRRREPTVGICRACVFRCHGFPPSRERRCGALAGGASASGRRRKLAQQVAPAPLFRAGTNATAGFRLILPMAVAEGTPNMMLCSRGKVCAFWVIARGFAPEASQEPSPSPFSGRLAAAVRGLALCGRIQGRPRSKRVQ